MLITLPMKCGVYSKVYSDVFTLSVDTIYPGGDPPSLLLTSDSAASAKSDLLPR